MTATTTDSRKWPLYCHFRLSVVVAIAWEYSFVELAMVEKPCRFAVWILMLCVVSAILAFPVRRPHCYFRLSINVAFICGHFPWASRCRKCCYCRYNVQWDLLCSHFGCISQHERKIPPNNSSVFDVMRNNFRCTDRRSGCCVLSQIHIQKRS